MIYEYIKGQIETVAGLEDKAFPIGLCIDDVAAPFAVYQFLTTSPVRDLAGEIHHYTETVAIEVAAADYDTLQEIFYPLFSALDVSNLDTGNGEYIFRCETSSEEPEAFDPDLALWRRTVLAQLDWCPVEDETGAEDSSEESEG